MQEVKFLPNIEYTGTVKLRIINDNGYVLTSKSYNKGTDSLFKFISMLLCREQIANEAPSRIDIVSNGTSILYSSSGVGITGRTYDQLIDGIGWCAKFRANIPNSIVNKESLSNIVEFQLRGGPTEYLEPFAKVDVSKSIIEELLPGTTLSIEWILQFANAQNQPDYTVNR